MHYTHTGSAIQKVKVIHVFKEIRGRKQGMFFHENSAVLVIFGFIFKRIIKLSSDWVLGHTFLVTTNVQILSFFIILI